MFDIIHITTNIFITSPLGCLLVLGLYMEFDLYILNVSAWLHDRYGKWDGWAFKP